MRKSSSFNLRNWQLKLEYKKASCTSPEHIFHTENLDDNSATDKTRWKSNTQMRWPDTTKRNENLVLPSKQNKHEQGC